MLVALFSCNFISHFIPCYIVHEALYSSYQPFVQSSIEESKEIDDEFWDPTAPPSTSSSRRPPSNPPPRPPKAGSPQAAQGRFDDVDEEESQKERDTQKEEVNESKVEHTNGTKPDATKENAPGEGGLEDEGDFWDDYYEEDDDDYGDEDEDEDEDIKELDFKLNHDASLTNTKHFQPNTTSLEQKYVLFLFPPSHLLMLFLSFSSPRFGNKINLAPLTIDDTKHSNSIAGGLKEFQKKDDLQRYNTTYSTHLNHTPKIE